jgi:hypothetical protein
VERIVHTGNVLGVGFGMQSKHSVLSYEKGIDILGIEDEKECPTLSKGWT